MLSRTSSPNCAASPLSLISEKFKAGNGFTMGDFITSDDDIEAIIAQIQQEETGKASPPTSSVKYSHPFPPFTHHYDLDVIYPG